MWETGRGRVRPGAGSRGRRAASLGPSERAGDCARAGPRELLGYPGEPAPSVGPRATEAKWLLIENPRLDDVASEPAYVWVAEDKVPTTMKSLVFGKSSLLAPPDIVPKYGAPPGGGRISPRQSEGV